MLKTSFKIFMLFVLMVCVAVATGLATYTITKRLVEEQSAAAQQTHAEQQPKNEEPVAQVGARAGEAGNIEFQYYVVRLEGNELVVYVSHDGREEFLYTREVYANDLSADDLVLLNEGVRLENTSELTGFIENFTS